MTIKTYDESGEGRTKVFMRIENSKVSSVLAGNNTVGYGKGIQFYVDDYVADQLHKCNFYLDGLEPIIELKEGEELEIPTEEEEKEKRRQELLQELEELKR